jgi:hypothetical protein
MEDEDDGDCGDFGQVCTHYFDLLTVWREEIEGEAATEGLCVPNQSINQSINQSLVLR